MAQYLPHQFLRNPKGISNVFNLGRGQEADESEAEEAAQIEERNYTAQKSSLRANLSKFRVDQQARRSKRKLELPYHIEYMKIRFFILFQDVPPHNIVARFKSRFGLAPVRYEDFNKTVTFAITNESLFANFIRLLEQFINSPAGIVPRGNQYAVITTIQSFEFITSSSIIQSFNYELVLLDLVNSLEFPLLHQRIYQALQQFLNKLGRQNPDISYQENREANFIEVRNLNRSQIQEIADNFDILYRVQSLKTPRIRPGLYNETFRDYGFTIKKDLLAPLVGVLDTGVQMINPLRPVIQNFNFDITNRDNPAPFMDEDGHGTAVAGLIAMGTSFYSPASEYLASATIVPIKILSQSTGILSLADLVAIIQKAHQEKGIRLFNLSVNSCFAKSYNSTVSEYAFALDRLTYELDILIFISTGNLNPEDLENLKENNQDALHQYPNHFFNPYKSSEHHFCEGTNLLPPADSYNNVTVGALADNLQTGVTDMTVDRLLPAYYTRKFYYDYSRRLNGTDFQKNQRNSHLFKPDMVFAGGDSDPNIGGIQVLGVGDRPDAFFLLNCGTSFATPLVTNIAAKIVRKYPKLSMQSVKALMINSSSHLTSKEFFEPLIKSIKEQIAHDWHGRDFLLLSQGEKNKISSLVSAERLQNYLCGHGKPDEDLCLNSSPNSITLVIEDSIRVETYKAITLRIPPYLKRLGNEKGTTSVLRLIATLCYKFDPVPDNHLAYCPLHISFNFIRAQHDQPDENASIISDDEHSHYSRFYEPTMTKEEKTKRRNREKAIKTNMETWSDDFYPRNAKPFANTQKKELLLRPIDLERVDNKVSLVIRAIHKTKVDPAVCTTLQNKAHPFSIVLTLTENAKYATGDLYGEVETENILEPIIQIEGLEAGDLEVES